MAIIDSALAKEIERLEEAERTLEELFSASDMIGARQEHIALAALIERALDARYARRARLNR